MSKKKALFWSKWAVIVAAFGIFVTGSALWYGNIIDASKERTGAVIQNQSSSGGGVNVGGSNSGTINAGN